MLKFHAMYIPKGDDIFDAPNQNTASKRDGSETM
jgi:hypothetical protein